MCVHVRNLDEKLRRIGWNRSNPQSWWCTKNGMMATTSELISRYRLHDENTDLDVIAADTRHPSQYVSNAALEANLVKRLVGIEEIVGSTPT